MTGLSIAVCTRNRAELLSQCLASLERQLDDRSEVDVIVVDNGSTDRTGEYLRTWGRRSDRLVVSEPRVGLSHARNAALRASEREVVLFVDDDALAPSTLARAHLDAHRSGPRVGAAGGPVGLTWPAGRPDWVTDGLTQWYSELDLGDVAGPYPNDHGPYGTNISVRRSAALEVGGFDPYFGRRGRRLLSGEERDLSHRLAAAGWTIVYAPAAAVIQQVLPERIRPQWLLRRGWSQGVTNARFAIRDESPTATALLHKAADSLRSALQQMPRSRGDAALAEAVVALAHVGSAVELVRSSVPAIKPTTLGPK